jgi:hypothetical protein
VAQHKDLAQLLVEQFRFVDAAATAILNVYRDPLVAHSAHPIPTFVLSIAWVLDGASWTSLQAHTM